MAKKKNKNKKGKETVRVPRCRCVCRVGGLVGGAAVGWAAATNTEPVTIFFRCHCSAQCDG
eukprot:COSAG02_NODE_57893_length_279_cov_0.577778_1_plen_60_part_10